jgi:hypothetical protein
MEPWIIVLLSIIAVIIIALVVLYFAGSKLQKKQEDQQAMLKAAEQHVSMLVIDKKKMKISEAGLPKIVYEQTPKYLRRSKLPIVKAKIGSKIMTFIADEKVFLLIPVKTEVKAVISGLYITAIKGARGGLLTPPKKKTLIEKINPFKK